MSLRVMTLLGCFVLVLGFMLVWLAPATTSQPRPVKPVGTSALSHGGSSSAGLPKSRMDRPESVGSRHDVDTQGR